MGSSLSRRRRHQKQRSISEGSAAAAFRQESLGDSLLGAYSKGLGEEEIALQFEGGKELKRFWLCKQLVDKPLFVNILSYLAAPELMTATEINRVWFDCADTVWLWDQLDGIVGLEDVSMGRYDYRCRHHRMKLTREEKRRHRNHIAGSEIEEHREHMYRGEKSSTTLKKETVDKAKKMVNQGKEKAFSCVTKGRRSFSGSSQEGEGRSRVSSRMI